MRPETVWRAGRWAHRRGWRRVARLTETLNLLLFRCVLPASTLVGGKVELYHRGLGVVFAEGVCFEGDAVVAHNVTLGAAGYPHEAPPVRVVVEQGAFIGAASTVMARRGRTVRIGRYCTIGAGAVVVNDVEPGARVAAAEGRVVGVDRSV